MSPVLWVTFALLLVSLLCFGVTEWYDGQWTLHYTGCNGQFDDRRCKCICPAGPDSQYNVNVTVVSVQGQECNCEHVTGRSELECLRCECKYEVRSTIIIQVVVIFVLVLIVVLLVYLIALLIMDPGMLKRSESDRRRLTQENLEVSEATPGQTSLGRRLSRVGSAQKRWRHKVKQQRQDVFRDHTLLS